MRIEKLLPPTPPAKTWTVALEGGKTLRVTESTVLDQGLFAGLELDEAALDALRSAAASAALRARAVNMLSVRAMSAGQLNEKLMAKGATEHQAAETVAWAVEIGLVNDAEYAKALVRHYQAKGYGLYKIKNELYRRRVPRLRTTLLLNAAAPGRAGRHRRSHRRLPDQKAPGPGRPQGM